jgi:hypothetical protein
MRRGYLLMVDLQVTDPLTDTPRGVHRQVTLRHKSRRRRVGWLVLLSTIRFSPLYGNYSLVDFA